MEKLKLFEITFNKLSGDKSYLAYYLTQLMSTENKTPAEIMQLLNCSNEDYYKLALCRAPEPGVPDFKERIKKIAEYSNTSEIILGNIINHSTIKDKKPLRLQPTLWEESWSIFKRLIPIPAWAYQPVLTTLVIVLFVIPIFSMGNETKNLQLYMGDFVHYTDSVKYMQLQDNTSVYKGNL